MESGPGEVPEAISGCLVATWDPRATPQPVRVDFARHFGHHRVANWRPTGGNRTPNGGRKRRRIGVGWS